MEVVLETLGIDYIVGSCMFAEGAAILCTRPPIPHEIPREIPHEIPHEIPRGIPRGIPREIPQVNATLLISQGKSHRLAHPINALKTAIASGSLFIGRDDSGI
jgi:hypothetical protein